MKDKIVTRLIRISEYFENYPKAHNDKYSCYKHHNVEHWGKLAYALQVNAVLYKKQKDSVFLDRGISILRGLSSQLRFDGEKYIYYPGLLNKYNASNNSIDCGGILDSISVWKSICADQTPKELMDFIYDSAEKVTDSYILGKKICSKNYLNQILWAYTGMASVYAHLHKKDEYRQECEWVIKETFKRQCDDGAFLYFTQTQYKTPTEYSAQDISSYYHSRHIGFLIHIAQKINYQFSVDEKEKIKKGLDFLLSLYAPNGTKNIQNEAKHWYWIGSKTSETASCSFDFHSIYEGYRLLDEDRYLEYAQKIGNSFIDSCDKDGAVESGTGDLNFQCKIFWSAHTAWISKSYDLGIDDLNIEKMNNENFNYSGKNTGVIKVQNAKYSFLARSQKRPLTPIIGAYAAGGPWGLYRKKDNWQRNVYERKMWSFDMPGEVFVISPFSKKLWIEKNSEFIRKYKMDYRFILATVKNFWLAKRWWQGFYFFFRVFVKENLFFFGPIESSFWASKSEFDYSEGNINLSGPITPPSGKSIQGLTFEKSFKEVNDSLEAKIKISNIGGAKFLLFSSSVDFKNLKLSEKYLKLGQKYWVFSKSSTLDIDYDIEI